MPNKQRVALLNTSGEVINVAVFDADWNEPNWNGHEALPLMEGEAVNVGWVRDGTQWIKPTPSDVGEHLDPLIGAPDA